MVPGSKSHNQFKKLPQFFRSDENRMPSSHPPLRHLQSLSVDKLCATGAMRNYALFPGKSDHFGPNGILCIPGSLNIV